MFDQERAEKIRQMLEQMSAEDLDQLLDRLAQKLVDEGYLSMEQEPEQQGAPQGGQGNQDSKIKVEVTDKSIDFLGFKTLKDLLGSLGKSSFGAHDTRDRDRPRRHHPRTRQPRDDATALVRDDEGHFAPFADWTR